jgi:peroxiredoxin
MKILPAFRQFAFALLMCLPLLAVAAPEIGKPAPEFVGTDSSGKTVRLSDLKGKIVVLEWSNSGCPYVQKWYKSGAMQKLQQEAKQLGIVWLTVISSAPGEQGYVSAEEANKDTQSRNAAPAHVLLDPKGTIGHQYDARTTPQVFIINADGKLAYMGGADSIVSTNPADIAKAEPYVHDAIAAGKPVKNPVTKPYGCSVKYAK